MYVYIANWKITMSDIGKSTIHCNFRCVKLPEGYVQQRENSNGEDLNAWESLGRKLDVNGRWSYSIWVLFDCLVSLMGWFSFYNWVVVSNIFFYCSHHIGNVIIPTDFHIFQRGWNHQPEDVSAWLWANWTGWSGLFCFECCRHDFHHAGWTLHQDFANDGGCCNSAQNQQCRFSKIDTVIIGWYWLYHVLYRWCCLNSAFCC